MATVLKLGSRGAAVRALQELLNMAGARPPCAPDENFGGETETAVRAFQDRAGLVVDGAAGPQTLAALRQATTPAKPGRVEPDKSAMAQPVPDGRQGASYLARKPPNVDALKLLDTARPISEIIVHCTATPEARDYTVADICGWHKLRGFSDIGYHYVVYRDGRVMLGRPVGQVGAHVEGHNAGTIGVSYVGGVSTDGKTAKDTRTSAQRGSLLWLVGALAEKHRGVRKITGHNQYANKACPSFDVRQDPLASAA